MLVTPAAEQLPRRAQAWLIYNVGRSMKFSGIAPYIPEAGKWLLYTAIPAGVAWLATSLTLWRSERKKKKSFRAFIDGLPVEAREVLMCFKKEGSHTVVLNPSDPIVRYLERIGAVVHVGSAGGHDAVSGLFMLTPDFRTYFL